MKSAKIAPQASTLSNIELGCIGRIYPTLLFLCHSHENGNPSFSAIVSFDLPGRGNLIYKLTTENYKRGICIKSTNQLTS